MGIAVVIFGASLPKQVTLKPKPALIIAQQKRQTYAVTPLFYPFESFFGQGGLA
jgi:hypothetical protein